MDLRLFLLLQLIIDSFLLLLILFFLWRLARHFKTVEGLLRSEEIEKFSHLLMESKKETSLFLQALKEGFYQGTELLNELKREEEKLRNPSENLRDGRANNQQEVMACLKAGFGVEETAIRLGIPLGEVQLIAELSKAKGSLNSQ